MEDKGMDQNEDECRNEGETNNKQDDEVVLIIHSTLLLRFFFWVIRERSDSCVYYNSLK